jgi:putative oxidoreductase
MGSLAFDRLAKILTHPVLVPFEFLFVRIFMALMFIESFIEKLLHWNHSLIDIAINNVPFPAISLTAATAIEIFGSICLLSGRCLRYGAIFLAAYVFILQFFYFDFWNHTGLGAVIERREFLKNMAVIAGLFLLALVDSAKQVRLSASTLP